MASSPLRVIALCCMCRSSYHGNHWKLREIKDMRKLILDEMYFMLTENLCDRYSLAYHLLKYHEDELLRLANEKIERMTFLCAEFGGEPQLQIQ